MHTRNRARTFVLATIILVTAGVGFGGAAQADTLASDLRLTTTGESTTPDVDCTPTAGVKICLPDPAYLFCLAATGERDYCAFVT